MDCSAIWAIVAPSFATARGARAQYRSRTKLLLVRYSRLECLLTQSGMLAERARRILFHASHDARTVVPDARASRKERGRSGRRVFSRATARSSRANRVRNPYAIFADSNMERPLADFRRARLH